MAFLLPATPMNQWCVLNRQRARLSLRSDAKTFDLPCGVGPHRTVAHGAAHDPGDDRTARPRGRGADPGVDVDDDPMTVGVATWLSLRAPTAGRTCPSSTRRDVSRVPG